MSSRGEETRRQKRAPAACDFCRHRKMKCDNEKPRCRHCKERGRECVYAELIKKSRPSTAQISRLEEENRRLRESLSSLKELHSPEGVPEDATNHARLPNPSSEMATSHHSDLASWPCRISSIRPDGLRGSTGTPLITQATVAPKTFAPDKESYYHGPTSAAFHEASTESEKRPNRAMKIPEVWVRRQLVAESANQHQLETVNFLDGKLDFDDVDPELGMHLLSIYWNRQQSSGLVVYRTTFMRDMACAGPYFSKLLLNAMYFYACKYTSRKDVRRDPNNVLTAGWMYRQRAADILSRSFDKSEIPTIQALLILSSALFSWCDEKSVSWLYAGMAINMIIDLGMNADSTTLRRQFSEEDLEIRRRLFWATYVIDKFQSLYQGRPARLHEHSQSLAISFLDDHEELELFQPLSYTDLADHPITPRYCISSFKQSCKLSIILDKILQSFYAEAVDSRPLDSLLKESKSIEGELRNWRNTLPPHLNLQLSDPISGTILPHTLSLLAAYSVLLILIYRPFVSDGHLSSVSPAVALDAFSKCSVAAFDIDNILHAYDQRFCLKATPYIMSYATYVSATIHVRLAAQRQPGSDAHKALRRCLDVLNIHQSVCWGPRRAKRVIDRLIADMDVTLDDEALNGGSSNLTTSNLDIDAIIRTFARDGLPPQVPGQNLVHSLGANGLDSTGSGDFVQQPLDGVINEDLSIPLTTGDMGFLYDPIFGFNGLNSNEFDTAFRSGFTWDG